MSRTVTHIDVAYDVATAAKISTLRAERWGALTTIEHLQKVDTKESETRRQKLWRQVRRYDVKLYQLTGNEVYK